MTIAGGSDWIAAGSAAEAQFSREALHFMDLGLSPLGAVAAMTANGPFTVGTQARKSGRLEAGYDADIMALDRNPVADRSAWADPERVTHVWKAGRLVKAGRAVDAVRSVESSHPVAAPPARSTRRLRQHRHHGSVSTGQPQRMALGS